MYRNVKSPLNLRAYKASKSTSHSFIITAWTLYLLLLTSKKESSVTGIKSEWKLYILVRLGQTKK